MVALRGASQRLRAIPRISFIRSYKLFPECARQFLFLFWAFYTANANPHRQVSQFTQRRPIQLLLQNMQIHHHHLPHPVPLAHLVHRTLQEPPIQSTPQLQIRIH